MELKKGETIMTDAALHLPASFLHEAFSERSGVPPDHFELYFRGKRLEGEAALASWGVGKGSTIEVKMRGRGGMLPGAIGRGGSPNGGGRRSQRSPLLQARAEEEARVAEEAEDARERGFGGASNQEGKQPQTSDEGPSFTSMRIAREEEQVKTAAEPVSGAESVAGKSPDDETAFSKAKLETELQTIKASTMYEMVDDVNPTTKVLFLTNEQAEIVSRTSDNLQRMLDTIVGGGGGKPKLVINLLPSGGFRTWLNAFKNAKDLEKTAPGCKEDQPPFLSSDDERAALMRLDQFMADVLIPLATRTNAIILCEGIGEHGCVLTSALTRMYGLTRSKWGVRPPFSIVSMTCYTQWLYCNPAESAHWRIVREASKAWKQRDPKLLEAVESKFKEQMVNDVLPRTTNDLDPEATCLLIVDTLNVKNPKNHWMGDESSFNKLKTELMRHLSSNLPSLALRTGGGALLSSLSQLTQNAAGLGPAISALQSGVPLIFLDVRERRSSDPRVEQAKNRAALIEEAKSKEAKLCDKLLAHEPPLANTLFISSLSCMHDALKGDGDPATTGSRSSGRSVETPLHVAIKAAERQKENRRPRTPISFDPKVINKQDELGRASDTQIAEAAIWLANRYFSNALKSDYPSFALNFCRYHSPKMPSVQNAFLAWKQCLKGEEISTTISHEALSAIYGKRLDAHTAIYRTLLSSPHLHCTNISDLHSAKQLIHAIVKLDRLPKENPIAGLLLLRSAWCEFDVAMLLASRYKFICKMLLASQLLVGWAIVFFGTLASDTILDAPDLKRTLLETVFMLSVIASIVLGIEGLLSAKARWYQLRASAGSLESIIWCAARACGS